MLEETTGKLIMTAAYYGWKDKHLYVDNFREYKEKFFCRNNLKNVNRKKKIPTVQVIPDNAKLIFHSTSKFPRHKLAITNYQRKIKEALADYMVGNAEEVKWDQF